MPPDNLPAPPQVPVTEQPIAQPLQSLATPETAIPQPEAAPQPEPIQAQSMVGVDSDEVLITTIRRHFFGIFILYIQTALALVVGIGLVYFLLPNFVDRSRDDIYKAAGFVAGSVVILMAVILVIATIIYYSSRLIVTDKNITQVIQAGIVNRKVSQLDVANIEDVSAIKKGIFPSLLNFGTLKIETAGAIENFSFNYCPRPDYYAKQILEARERIREHRRYS